MNNFEKLSDTKWKNYWDNLMLKSKKPVPWGTIVEEKPDHSNLNLEEELKQHKVEPTKNKFKKKRFKSDD